MLLAMAAHSSDVGIQEDQTNDRLDYLSGLCYRVDSLIKPRGLLWLLSSMSLALGRSRLEDKEFNPRPGYVGQAGE